MTDFIPGGFDEGGVYEVEGSDDVINIEKWPDVETTEAVMKSETFRNFIPRLIPHFAGNKTLILHER